MALLFLVINQVPVLADAQLPHDIRGTRQVFPPFAHPEPLFQLLSLSKVPIRLCCLGRRGCWCHGRLCPRVGVVGHLLFQEQRIRHSCEHDGILGTVFPFRVGLLRVPCAVPCQWRTKVEVAMRLLLARLVKSPLAVRLGLFSNFRKQLALEDELMNSTPLTYALPQPSATSGFGGA
jgi:hypothetical protein